MLVELKEGFWREVYKEDDDCLWTKRRFYCSACGSWQTYGETRYCPDCGAKMTKEETK